MLSNLKEYFRTVFVGIEERVIKITLAASSPTFCFPHPRVYLFVFNPCRHQHRTAATWEQYITGWQIDTFHPRIIAPYPDYKSGKDVQYSAKIVCLTGLFIASGSFDTSLISVIYGRILKPFGVVIVTTVRFCLVYDNAWQVARYLWK